MSIAANKDVFAGETISDALRRRGVRELVYFHTDHFEPWRLVPDRTGGMDRCIEDVERYLETTAKLDFARKASLFYKPNVNYHLSADRALYRADPEDLLGFVPRSPVERRIGPAILRPIVDGSDHEVQVHIHHENFTYNDTARDPEPSAYLRTPRGRSFDTARLELLIHLSLDVLRQDAGLELPRWFFVHGHWALNASDPHECTIVREIELLMRNGCLGDFTLPAGRPHVDSRIDVPFLADPVALPKGYDTPEARPTQAAGAGEAEAAKRFFIWSSATTADSCSIDIYGRSVQRRAKTPTRMGLEQAQAGVVIDGVLYVKTHGHSLHPNYYIEGARPMPHMDPDIRAELGALFDAADNAGAMVSFLNASEVYDKIVAATAPKPRDLIEACGLRAESPMERIGVTVVFRTALGAEADPPPLPPRLASLPDALPARAGGASGDEVWGADAIAHIVFLDALDLDTEGRLTALMNVETALPTLLLEPDVVMVNAKARRVALERAEELGDETSGVTGFYGSRAREGALLQPSEILCAAFVQAHLPGVRAVYEIGCGLGLLTTLLALRGMSAVGVERSEARLATAEAICKAVMASEPSSPPLPLWVKGGFPGVLRREAGKARSVALVTNLLGSATIDQQAKFVAGLRYFGAVLIDMERFYVRRTSRSQIDELARMFTDAGFSAPRLAFDLGSDGRFMLFTNPQPKRRPGLDWLTGWRERKEPPLFLAA